MRTATAAHAIRATASVCVAFVVQAASISILSNSGWSAVPPDQDYLEMCTGIDEREDAQTRLTVCTHQAEGGSLNSQYFLGRIYWKGVEGIASDIAKAIYWFEKSANQGAPEAQYALGTIYLQAVGVNPDPKKAMKWLRMAADQQHPGAAYFIGILYQDGIGVAKDLSDAKSWYETAAAGGNRRAAYRLGEMYETGEGVPVDVQMAKRFYAEAGKKGYEPAREKLLASGEWVPSIDLPGGSIEMSEDVKRAAFDALLAASEMECEFSDGAFGSWEYGESRFEGANWTAGKVEITSLPGQPASLVINGRADVWKRQATAVRLHFLHMDTQGNLTVLTVIGGTDNTNRYFAMLSSHSLNFYRGEASSAQYLGRCEIPQKDS